MKTYLNTGLKHCYDARGGLIDCAGTGQDAELSPGLGWPEPRFEDLGDTVRDLATGLTWSKAANAAEFPLSWAEALDFVASLNEEGRWGHGDWRLPNRRELRSLIDYSRRKPALPEGHPFIGVVNAWHWTGTTSAVNTAYAWYVHLEGGRMFYGHKEQSYLVWPVRGASEVLPATGQRLVYDAQGKVVPRGAGAQDGEIQAGVPWPEPRFETRGEAVLDRLTNLIWTRRADLANGPIGWFGALEAAAALNESVYGGLTTWRLPTINELESLVDAGRHTPALPENHPFTDLHPTYASSTTSGFEPDWCMVLHLHKGAVGVGQKIPGKGAGFHVWAVSSEEKKREEFPTDGHGLTRINKK